MTKQRLIHLALLLPFEESSEIIHSIHQLAEHHYEEIYEALLDKISLNLLIN